MTTAIAVDAVETPAAPPGVPERIGRFVIREEIGRGSNGVVYAASDPVLGRDVAIKAIPLPTDGDSTSQDEANFLQEAKTAAGLNHPSIVTVFDAGHSDSFAYIAMERLKGADLHQWMANNRPMSAESAAALVARVADAVHFAHRRGLIHRDIKPSNIFLGRDMKPKVLDFGIALAQGKQFRVDEPRKLIGTPNYMSPEQAMGRPLDARSDVFSIGAILYELLTGHRAFDGASVDDILTKVVKDDPPALHVWRSDMSPVMGEIVFRAIAKNPDQRYQSAGQLRNDLAAFAGRPVGPPTSPPSGINVRAARARFAMPAPSALITTAIAVVGLSLAFAFWYATHRVDGNAGAAGELAQGDGTPVNPAPPPVVAPPPPAPEPLAKPAPHVASPGPRMPAAHHGPGANARARPPVVIEAPPPPPEPGALALAIAPWGEVFIDGASVGVSPPLTRLSIAPGAHSVSVRNGNGPAYTAMIEVESGKTLTLQHRF
jgi:serine/threonine-protein kinase